MSEEEKLTLDIEVDYGDDDDLERLEDALDSVDRAISDTGKGRDEARVDVEAQTADAHGELVGIKSAVEALDDEEATVDVEIEERDFDTVVSEMIEEGAHEADVGRFNFDQDIIDDSSIVDELEAPETLTPADQRLAEAIGSATADGRGPSGKRDFGRFAAEAATTDEEVDVRFESAFDTEETEALELLDEDDVFGGFEFDQNLKKTLAEQRAEAIEDIDVDEQFTAPSGGNIGIAAEGVDPQSSVDLLQAQRDADDFRDNRSMLAQLGDQARELGGELKDARFTMEQFHAIFASLVPIAVVFIGAMPAAITALAGLAGAALAATAAVGAIGLLGLGGMALTGSGELDIQPILERMQGIFDTFITAFTPLMNRFQPLVESAFDTLEGLANPLASAMAPLTMFESTFEGLIESVAAGLPSFTTKVLAFAQATMPMLMSIANFFENADFIGFFANQLEKARFTFILLGFALKEIVPFLINFSQGFLLVASGIIGVLGVIGGLIDAVPYLTFGLGALIAAGLLLVSITSLLTVVGFALEHQLYAQTAALLGNVKAEIAATIATYGLAKSIAFLIGVITLGVGALVALGAAGSFVADRFNLANSELSEFNKLAGNMPNSIGGQFGSPTAMGRGGGSNAYNIDINASSPEESRRASNRVKYEIRNTEQVNSVFGGN